MKYLSLTELNNWLNFYYQHPQPELTANAIASLSKEGYLADDDTQESLIFFLSFIFRTHGDRINQWVGDLVNLPEIEQIVIIYALWLANTTESQAYLTNLSPVSSATIQEIISNFQTDTPPRVDDLPIDHPHILDLLWAAFFATGEEKYVLRIISALSQANLGNDLMNQSIYEAAKWSIQANVNEHEKVRLICNEQLHQQPEDIVLILQEVLK